MLEGKNAVYQFYVVFSQCIQEPFFATLLTLYQTFLSFDDLEGKAFPKHHGKMRKCCL